MEETVPRDVVGEVGVGVGVGVVFTPRNLEIVFWEAERVREAAGEF